MEKTVLAGASYLNRKFFMDESFGRLPGEIKKEIKALCAVSAERLAAAFVMGFNPDGSIYFEIIPEEGFACDDDIGREYILSEIRREKAELLNSLILWNSVFTGLNCAKENRN